MTLTSSILTGEQVKTFQKDGILVVDNILTDYEVRVATEGLRQTLLRFNVDTNNLTETAHHLRDLSSTGGSGGVLDLFYPPFKMDIACNEKLFGATSELWSAAYCHNGETETELRARGNPEQFHPFGEFNVSKGYIYIDRIGYRIPTKMAEQIGGRVQNEINPKALLKKPNGSKRKKNIAIQRSLTPHLDCCPDTYNSKKNKTKWRPIQCFVSLTDNLKPNTGGFEAAPGFHHDFDEWAKERLPSTITKRDVKTGAKSKVKLPAPCIGEYTHIRPKEDEHVMKAIQHVPVRAGSAVFWDTRIPHANSYKNTSDIARAVVYCSFLPDVEINRLYAEKQLEDYRKGNIPRDQWHDSSAKESHQEYEFSELGRKLMKIDDW